ncbi:MAG: cytochrome c oxidase accessory protein FixG, partial [Paracoccaceae bacterium]
PIAYTTIAILTATTFVFGGFMREQICIYACPWPRIQAAMMDEHSITVAYRDWRGEPRGKHRKAEGAELLGDCIDCNACVAVCPMGIDIRDGQQMECITCALCIDACDDVMAKIGSPRGLIDYMALTDEQNERSGRPKISIWKHVFHFRTMFYTALWSGIGVALVVLLFIRSEIDVTIAPIRNPVFVTMSDGSIRNAYDLRLRNMYSEDRLFEVSLTAEDVLQASLEGTEMLSVWVPADSSFMQRVYVTARPNSQAANRDRTEFRFWVEDQLSGDRTFGDTVFNGRVTQ